jgi:ribosome-associated protein
VLERHRREPIATQPLAALIDYDENERVRFAGMADEAREISIEDETIRLGQLLKLAGVVDSGSEVKALLTQAPVEVNGERESRRGRQLRTGDVVRVGGQQLRVHGAATT